MITAEVLEPLPAITDLAAVRREVEKVRRWSDGLVKLGPLKLGLDGLIGFIPGAGDLYTIGAGGYLIFLARRARAPRSVIVKMIGWLALDFTTGIVPIAGDAIDFFFRGHAKAAATLLAWLDTVDPQPRPVGGWREKIGFKRG